MISIFRADAFGGFDFNEDESFAPARAFKGGPSAYLVFDNNERIDIPNMWACVVDVTACMNIMARLSGELNYIEAVNHVHIHELCHACDDGKASRYDYDGYSHTYHWGKVLTPISKIEHSLRKEKDES